MRPQKKKRILAFCSSEIRRRKLCAFYHYSTSRLRQMILRYRHSNNGYNGFLAQLESQLHIILWRSAFFKNPTIIKALIMEGKTYIIIKS